MPDVTSFTYTPHPHTVAKLAHRDHAVTTSCRPATPPLASTPGWHSR